MRGTALILLLGVWLGTTPGAAQGKLHGPAPSSLFGLRSGEPVGSPVVELPNDSIPQPRSTYWLEGAVAGGVLGLVGGALVGHQLCGLAEESSKNCTGSTVLGGVLGAAVLAIPGALIGGQFSKQPDGRWRVSGYYTRRQ